MSILNSDTAIRDFAERALKAGVEHQLTIITSTLDAGGTVTLDETGSLTLTPTGLARDDGEKIARNHIGLIRSDFRGVEIHASGESKTFRFGSSTCKERS